MPSSDNELLSRAQPQIAIRRTGGLPIYVQLADILEDQIAGLEPSARRATLPSEGELSREFKVSRVTVRQALKRLESRGLIYSEQGKGSFPTLPRMRGVSGFHSFTAEVLKNGGEPGSLVLEAKLVGQLPEQMVQRLTPAGSRDGQGGYFLLKRVRSINGVPVAVEDAYLPHASYPGIESASFEDASLYDAIVRRWGLEPAWTDALLEPATATAEQARQLGVREGDPLLVAWRVTLTANDTVIEYVRSMYRGGDFMLHIGRYRLA